MGMTIYGDIEMLELIYKDYKGCKQGIALKHAINNLRIYQKIVEIMYYYDDSYDRAKIRAYDDIKEVLNGKA